jgi:hypothetical protein
LLFHLSFNIYYFTIEKGYFIYHLTFIILPLKKAISFIIYHLSFIIFICGCANRVAPTGGDKDTLSPLVINSFPKNLSKQFKGNIIILEFDEWVKEKELSKNLLITPPIKDYTYSFKKNRLTISLKEPLKENATYNINFRQGIVDITEGNIAFQDTTKLSPPHLAFSTGEILDSAKISGKIKYLFTNKPAKDAIIGLYPSNDTLIPQKHPPYYYALADENGAFYIQNIKSDNYRLYAWADKNSNQTYEEPEQIGFLEEMVDLKTKNKMDSIKFFLAKEDHTKPEINKQFNVNKSYSVEYNEGLTEILFAQNDKFAHNLNADKKTIQLFNQFAIKDTIITYITVKDSVGNQKKDTLKFAFDNEKEKENKKERKENPKKKNNNKQKTSKYTWLPKAESPTNGIENDAEILINFDKPVLSFDSTRLYIRLDKDTLKKYNIASLGTWNEYKDQLKLKITKGRLLNFKENIHLFADSVAFVSIEKDTSQKFNQTFTRKNPANFASISGKVNTKEKNYIIQLLDASGKVLKEAQNTKKFEFNFLSAGTYQMRVIIDTNQNGKWDGSDVKNFKPAEKMLFLNLQNGGKLKERWEMSYDAEF